MNNGSLHSFHIPVMGLAYTVDTPIKVARFGISSVVSIIEDNLLEEMRKYYCDQQAESYTPIRQQDPDGRARRVTAYLDLMDRIVSGQMEQLRASAFGPGTELDKFFILLPQGPLGLLYEQMNSLVEGDEKRSLQHRLRDALKPGSIDVNIMTKCDKTNYDTDGTSLPAEYSDAMAALRGYANSGLSSSIIFSAGMNPRLYTYCETFSDFFPDECGVQKKKIILKVSDYRSAMIQGKFLAKKGLWVSEFRIESGLNCGGHAFATDGYLLAPVLEEFKSNRAALSAELFGMCNEALAQKGVIGFPYLPQQKISVQGGIGTAREHQFLLDHYGIDSAGWGSPFLMVPEATNVDEETLQKLMHARKEDYYLSNASPLDVLFNNFRKSSSEADRIRRIEKGQPGSPCYNKYLSNNTEFTEQPICTASRQYQDLKIKQLKSQELAPDVLKEQIGVVTEKECICQGLGTSVFLTKGLPVPHKLAAVSICPGPNLAYFSGSFSLKEMVDHIYGRGNVLNAEQRPNMFINELKLYVNYLEKEISKSIASTTAKRHKYLQGFKDNLLSGVDYYKSLVRTMHSETEQYRERFAEALRHMEHYLSGMPVPMPALVQERVVGS